MEILTYLIVQNVAVVVFLYAVLFVVYCILALKIDRRASNAKKPLLKPVPVLATEQKIPLHELVASINDAWRQFTRTFARIKQCAAQAVLFGSFVGNLT